MRSRGLMLVLRAEHLSALSLDGMIQLERAFAASMRRWSTACFWLSGGLLLGTVALWCAAARWQAHAPTVRSAAQMPYSHTAWRSTL